MKHTFTVPCLLICTAASASANAQSFNENSVPEPTELFSAATSAGALIRVAGTPERVESSDSALEVAAVQVRTANGESYRGIRLFLENSTDMDRLYLDAAQAAQLRDELANFQGRLESTMTCSSRSHCVHGIARCRPSQSVAQAICPAVYFDTDGERGVLLSTPRFSFRYPSTQIGVLVEAFDAVVADVAR